MMWYLLSKIYEIAVRLRTLLYTNGLLRPQRLKNPVISVGNLTVGGTGKTPLVCFLAQTLKRAGYQPLILSRGYRRQNNTRVLVVSDGRKIFCRPESCGDEPYFLAEKLEGVPVAVAKRRYQAGRTLEDVYENVIHLLDDGYQHLRLERNFNILVLDATDPFGGGHLLPAGRLREPMNALKRADSIIITRSHAADNPDELEAAIRKWNKIASITHFYHDVTGLCDLKSKKRYLPRDFFGKRVIALAGIGNPKVFLNDLKHYQINVVEQFIFRDHHPYAQTDVNRLLKCSRDHQAEGVVTTEKDAVRLRELDFEERQIFAAQIEMKAEDPAEYKRDFLNEVQLLRDSR